MVRNKANAIATRMESPKFLVLYITSAAGRSGMTFWYVNELMLYTISVENADTETRSNTLCDALPALNRL